MIDKIIKLFLFLIILMPVFLLSKEKEINVSAQRELMENQDKKIDESTEILKDLKDQVLKLNSEIEEIGKSNTRIMERLEKIERENLKLTNSIKENKETISQFKKEIEELKEDTYYKINTSVEEVETSTKQRMEELGKDMKKSSIIFFIICAILAVILGITSVIIYRRIKENRTDIEDEIGIIKNKYDGELSKMDLEISKKLERFLDKEMADKTEGTETEVDHSLSLTIADELNRMRRRMEHMPEDTKGLKALIKATERLEEKLNELGYEIIDLLGQPYAEGLTVTTTRFVPSEELSKGEQIISKVIKPQVNYNGVLVQSAEVEVSVGE